MRVAAGRSAAVAVVTNAVSLAAGFLAAALLSSGGLVGSTWLEPRSAARQLLVSAASVIPLVIALRVTGEDLASVGLTRARLARSVAIGLALAAIWLFVSGAFRELASPRPEHGYVLVAALSVGFAEEILSRGYLQSRLVAWVGLRRGIALAATVFAAFHIPQRLLEGVRGADLVLQIIVVALLGVAFGLLQAATRNVTLPAMVHTTIDWSARFSTLGR
jgi:membrane protease YdiL (CAAX protease family)